MLFKRREKLPWYQNLRQWVWPQSGWGRAASYVGHRLGRMNATPHAIAAGFASGVAISFTPFLGFHLMGAALMSLILRGHVISSAIGTLIGNPWTFPLIFAATGNLGAWYIGENLDTLMPTWDWAALLDDPLGYLGNLIPGLMPFIYGGIPAFIGSWVVSYILVKRGLLRYRAKRAHSRAMVAVVSSATTLTQ